MLNPVVEDVASFAASAKQLQAIALLAAGETIVRTAQLVAVDERTLYRWRAVPEFREAVREALAGVLDQAIARLITGVPDAVAVINRTHLGRGKVNRDRLANAQWVVERIRALADGFAVGPADTPQPGLTLSQSVHGSPADIAELKRLLQSDRDAKRSLLIEPDDVAQDGASPDPASD